MSTTTHALPAAEKAEQLPEDARAALRDLLLTLADSKRLLGIRFSDWMLGAPTLESGIAASSMAQDEWGHARLTYALLSDFGDEPQHVEHDREAAEYHSMETLDRPLESWSELVAAGLLLDTALAIQYTALLDTRYAPAQNRVQKLLDEEAFHFQYSSGWARKIGKTPAAREDFVAALSRFLPAALRWFGREDAPAARRLVDEGLVRCGPDQLRDGYLQRIGEVLSDAGVAEELGLTREGARWTFGTEADWAGWDDRSRRAGGEGPDAETLARVRGDKNRALLMD